MINQLKSLIAQYPKTYSQRLLSNQYCNIYEYVMHSTKFLDSITGFNKIALCTRCWYLLHNIFSKDQLLICKSCGNLIVKHHNINDKSQGTSFCNKYCKQQYFNQKKHNKKLNAPKTSIYYWQARGYSREEAILKVKEQKPIHPEYWLAKGYSEEEVSQKMKNKNNPIKTDYWIIYYNYSLDEAEKRVKQEVINRLSKHKQNKEYWLARGYSEEEAKQKAYQYWTEHNQTHVNYWLARGYSEEEAQFNVRKKAKKCPEYWLARGYSEEEAKQKAHEYAKTVAHSSIMYWLARGYSEEEAKQKAYESNVGIRKAQAKFTRAQNRLCPEYWLAKGYSEEEAKQQAKNANKEQTKNIPYSIRQQAGLKAHQNMSEDTFNTMRKKVSTKLKAKNKTHSPIFKEYWLARGYSEEEAKRQVSITKYSSVGQLSKASKIEIRFFDELIAYLISHHVLQSKDDMLLQKWVSINGKNYCQDGRYHNIVIEFNGTNFHMDPRFYTELDFNPRNVSYHDVRLKDDDKKNAYAQKQYNVIIVWEYDFLNHKEQVFQYIKESIINENSNKKGSCWDSASVFNKC